MAEVYRGTKFRTLFVSPEAPGDERVAELAAWCRRFAELGVARDGSGNLSFRSAAGFVISRTAADLYAITPGEFVEVLSVDAGRGQVRAAGAFEPSSESPMHAAIYSARPDVHAVFHGHSADLLREAARLGIPVTARERPYGTPELAEEVRAVLAAGRPLIALRGHGFVSLGRTMREAGRRVERIVARL